MKKLFDKYFYQSVIVSLLLVVALVTGLGYLVTNVFNVKSGYIGADKKILMTSGDASMTLDEGIFFAKNKQAYYEAFYLAAGHTMNWDAKDENGNIYRDSVTEESLQQIKEVFLLSEYAKTHGYELTSEDLDSIKADAKAFLNDSPETVIKATGANIDLLERVYTRTAYFNKVCDDIYSKTDLTVNDEDIKQCLVSVAEFRPAYYDSPDRTAQKIMERVNNGEIFSEVASKYGAKVGKGNVGKGDFDGNALEVLCLSLKDGECKITEENGTYYVAYCHLAFDEEATDEAKNLKIEELKDEAKLAFFNDLLKEMPISMDDNVWSTVTIGGTIFTKDDLKDSALTK